MPGSPLPERLGDLTLGAAGKCPRGQILRKAYATKAGIRVAASCVPDQGAPGKTPKSKQVLPKPSEGGLLGWKKAMPTAARRRLLREVARKDGCLTAVRRLDLLAKFTKKTSPSTRRAARSDAEWLRAQKFCDIGKKGRR